MLLTLLSALAQVAGFLFMGYSVLFFDAVHWDIFSIGVVILLVDKYLIPDKKHPSMLESQDIEAINVATDSQPIEFTMPVDEDTPLGCLIKPDFKGDLVLFFAIDGVFHPHQTETLELKHKLLELTEFHPNLELVMCSDWRATSPQAWFEKRFGSQLTERFKGCTPVLSSGEYRREREVLEFVRHFKVSKFVVVDDRQDLYQNDFEHLVLTDISVGITDETISEIAGRL